MNVVIDWDAEEDILHLHWGECPIWDCPDGSGQIFYGHSFDSDEWQGVEVLIAKERTEYDPVADAAYVRISDAEVVRTHPLNDQVILDYDAENRVVGVEVLDAGGQSRVRLYPV